MVTYEYAAVVEYGTGWRATMGTMTTMDVITQCKANVATGVFSW